MGKMAVHLLYKHKLGIAVKFLKIIYKSGLLIVIYKCVSLRNIYSSFYNFMSFF